MRESTAVTIDNIAKLAEALAKSEYSRGYANGLEEKRLTDKHWGKPKIGKWITRGVNGYYQCPFCKSEFFDDDDEMSNWKCCPVCEAKMEDKTE